MVKTTALCKKKSRKTPASNQVTYSCERIVDVRLVEGQRQYLIKWKDYGEEDNTWEPLSNLNYVLEDVLTFERSRQSDIAEMERKWAADYNAGKEQMPLEPFCQQRIEQKIRRNKAFADEGEREERKDKSDTQYKSDSDYEFETRKKRKIMATVKTLSKKKRSRKSKVNRNLKPRKKISKKKNEDNKQINKERRRQSKADEESGEYIGIRNIVNGDKTEEKDSKIHENFNDFQKNQVKKSPSQNGNEQKVDIRVDYVVVPAITDLQESVALLSEEVKAQKQDHLQSAIQLIKTQKEITLINQQSPQSNEKYIRQIGSVRSKQTIEKLIEESRQEIEVMRRKDCTLQVSGDARVNLGGCSNFPVARSVRKYTYVHKKNAEKPTEVKEGNEGKDFSVQQLNDGNTHNEAVFTTSPFDRIHDSGSNPLLPKSKSQSFTLQKAVHSYSPRQMALQSSTQKQGLHERNQGSIEQESEQCPSESEEYSVLSHSKSDLGPMLSINESFQIKIEPIDLKEDTNLKPSDVLREASNFLNSNGIFFNRGCKDKHPSEVIEVSSEESNTNLEHNKQPLVDYDLRQNLDSIVHQHQPHASSRPLYRSKFSEQSQSDSFQDLRTPKRKPIAKEYAPSRMSNKERSEKSARLSDSRRSRINGFSSHRRSTPQLTLVLDRLISSQLLRFGHRPTINRIVDSFQIDDSRIFEVEMKGNRAFGKLFASYESLREFYPRILLKYLEKTSSVEY